MNWNQPCCDACWIAYTLQHEMPGREPVRLRQPMHEQCCFCGEGTLSGIYVRVDPRTVAYPQEER